MESCWRWSAGMLVLALVSIRQCTNAAATSVSVCSYLCTCTNQNFATVDCEFNAASVVLDETLLLPSAATALNIKLIGGGQLAVRKDFFQQNSINHLSIEGNGSRSASVVEFHEGALCNINGQFPEILVTNVGRLIMNRNISCRAHLLNITHVNDVLLKTVFQSVHEAELFIRDVSNLQIEPNAFFGSKSSKIQIHRTNIESLPKLGASLRLLSFNDCNISEVVTHAFDAIEIEHVEFVGCRLANLRQQAIPERLLCYSLIFRDCHIQRIENRFVDGNGLKNLLLENNTINEIAPGAFTFTSINTIVTGNHVIRTGKQWLHQKEWENLTITGNSFGEFNGILLSKDKPHTHCHFGNNTITSALPNSFTFGRNCRINGIHFGRECDCTYDSWLMELVGARGESTPSTSSIISSASCQVDDSLRYCFNRSDAGIVGQVNVHYFLMEFCQREGSKKCSSYTSSEDGNRKPPPPLIPFERIDSLDDSDEGGFFLMDKMLWLWIAVAATAIVFLLLFTVCFYRRRANESRQTLAIQTMSSRSGTIRSNSLSRSAFTPADRRIIGNALSWIKQTYDQKVWNEINTPMQQLLDGGFIEEQVKVRLIGTVLDSLKRHEISATQIVALNDILFRQLGPPAPAPAAEPVETSRPNSDRNADELGHIYDELQLNRAPVAHYNVGLLGDYAAPLDHGGGMTTVVPEGIYSEPVLHDQLLLQRNGDNRNLISPYAIGDATVQRNPAGGEGNLPDVILLRRPPTTGNTPWRANTDDEEDEDEIDGEAERKTMLRPADCGDSGPGSNGPTYAISMKQLKRPHRGNTPPLPPLPPPSQPSDTIGEDPPSEDGSDGNRSEHSGSSMQTVRIEDMTLAVDTDSGNSSGGNVQQQRTQQ
uniref:Right handed beta helix domain-containing protein n=1 Tax=Anopheles maculatus TaxID=74869 RepID=A0A182T257_9DIPT